MLRVAGVGIVFELWLFNCLFERHRGMQLSDIFFNSFLSEYVRFETRFSRLYHGACRDFDATQ